MKVHQLFAKDQQSIERCFEVYFKDLKVIVKGQSTIDEANVLIGQTVWFPDRGDVKSLEIREATMVVGNSEVRLRYLVVLDQPCKSTDKKPIEVKVNAITLRSWKEWQGIYLVPTNTNVQTGSAM